jgi:hypothetical protein
VYAVLAGEFRQGVFPGQGIQGDSGFEFRAETFSRLGHELPPSGSLRPPYRVVQFSEATSMLEDEYGGRMEDMADIRFGILKNNVAFA